LGSIGPIGPQAAEDAAVAPGAMGIGEHCMQEIEIDGLARQRKAKVDAVGFDLDEGKLRLTDWTLEGHVESTMAITEPHLMQIGAVIVRRRLPDDFIVQKGANLCRLHQVPPIQPTDSALRREFVDRPANHLGKAPINFALNK
jgi:hypothetical protein